MLAICIHVIAIKAIQPYEKKARCTRNILRMKSRAYMYKCRKRMKPRSALSLKSMLINEFVQINL